jgi:formiminotetrahydrofolate cyclodeaminase
MRRLLERSEGLRGELTALIRADMAVFDRVMGAYGLPKNTEAEKAERSARIQEVLKEATDVPLACARLCREVILLGRETAGKGNRNVVSDAGAGVMAAYAGLKSAVLNVYVNAGSINDREFAQNRLAEVEHLATDAERETQEVFARVAGLVGKA